MDAEAIVISDSAVTVLDSEEMSLPHRKEFNLSTVLAPLTKKQKELIVYVALGEDDESSRELTGIMWRTWANWSRNPDFSWALESVKAELGAATSNQAAQMFLGGFSVKVLQDIGGMATKEWKDLKSSYEYQAKTKCMEIVQKSQGFTGPEKANVNIGWAENVAVMMKEV